MQTFRKKVNGAPLDCNEFVGTLPRDSRSLLLPKFFQFPVEE